MIHGVINVFKEKGFTSHDVVAKLRGILKQKKIGHTGTLDPDAEGVLPVCLGKATKLCDMLTDKDKTYQTVLLLGKVTDTQDITGKILEEKPTAVSAEQIRQAAKAYIGTYMQIPPMYSALKINGKKLYELAREGKEIDRPARAVQIHSLEIGSINIECQEVVMTVSCSKGTYIRTLCHDIGRDLGCGGCMKALLRTSVSQFTLKDSLTLSQIQELQEAGQLEKHMVKIDDMFAQYEAIQAKEEAAVQVQNGNPLHSRQLKEHRATATDCWLRLYDHRQQFIGIYMFDQEKEMYKPVKLFI